jgi:hypothetical protein
MIALGAGQAERVLLQDRVAPIPQRQSPAQPLLYVAEPARPSSPRRQARDLA